MTEQAKKPQMIEAEDGAITKSIKFQYLPMHCAFQSPTELMYTARIPLKDRESDESVLEKSRKAWDLIQSEFIRDVKAIEASPFIMQRISKDPDMLHILGNCPDSEKRISKEYLSLIKAPSAEVPPASAPQPQTQGQPLAPDPRASDEVKKQQPGPVPEPSKAPQSSSPPETKEDPTKKIMESIHAALMKAPNKTVMYRDMLQECNNNQTPERFMEIVEAMLKDQGSWGVREDPIGYLTLNPQKIGCKDDPVPPEKPAEKPDPVKEREAKRESERIATEIRERRERKQSEKGKAETEKLRELAKNPPKKTYEHHCPECDSDFDGKDTNSTGACPGCGSTKWKNGTNIVQNGTLDGQVLALVQEETECRVCPWCADAKTGKVMNLKDIEMAKKYKRKLVLCYNHSGELYQNEKTPSTKAEMEKRIGETIQKYQKEKGFHWEAV